MPSQHGVFAIGDVAAADPLRSSARNRGDALVASNIRAELAGRALRSYRAPGRRWGSLFGIQPSGLEVYFPPVMPCGSRRGRSSGGNATDRPVGHVRRSPGKSPVGVNSTLRLHQPRLARTH